MRTKNRSVSKATQRLEKVKEGRRQKLSALKDAFFRVTEKCPCCKGGSDAISITFWDGSGFSRHCPRWVVKCRSCGLKVDFWASSGEKAVVKFVEKFREDVTKRLMSPRRKLRRKNK